LNFSVQTTLAAIARKTASFGFVASYDGNVSLRRPEGIYITATRTLKSDAAPEDICLISLEGKLLEGKRPPSTESEMHLFIYRERADVKAIVHTHPPCTTAFAAARQALDLAVFPEVILDLGAVPLANYATPSTNEVAASLKPFITWANAVLLANHGVVVLGADIEEAFYRTEKLEHAAKTLLYAAALGGAVPLTKKEVDDLYATHHAFERRGEFAEFQSAAHQCECQTEKLVCKSCDEKNQLDMVSDTAKKILQRLGEV
jgi:L-fuculose-phosphate aldolase